MFELDVEDKIASYVFKWFTVVFLVVGTICNVLSAIVYSRKKMNKSSYSIYLFTLAIVDLMVTWIGNLRYALMFYEIPNTTPMITSSRYLYVNDSLQLNETTATTSSNTNLYKLLNATNTDIFWPGFDLRDTNIVVCRVHRFLNYYLLQFSSLLLCLLSIDRFFGCVLVLKASKFCKSTVARRFVIYAMIFLFFVNVHILIAMGYYETVTEPTNNNVATTIRNDTSKVSPNSNSLFIKAKPEAVNGTRTSGQANTNSSKIQQQAKQLQKQQTSSKIFRCEADPNNTYSKFWSMYFYIDGAIYCFIPFFIMVFCNTIIISKIIKSRKQSKQVIVKKQTRKILHHTSSGMLPSEKRLSVMLIGISMSFFILTIPVMIVEYLDPILSAMKAWPILISLAYMLMYMNHVINFFFYCVMGSKFRSEIKNLLPRFLVNRSKVNPVRQNQMGTTLVFETSGLPKTTFYMNKASAAFNSETRSQMKTNRTIISTTTRTATTSLTAHNRSTSIRYVKTTSRIRLISSREEQNASSDTNNILTGFSKEDYKRNMKKYMSFFQRLNHNLNMRKTFLAFNNARSAHVIDFMNEQPPTNDNDEEEDEAMIRARANLVRKRRSIAAATFLGYNNSLDEEGNHNIRNFNHMKKFYRNRRLRRNLGATNSIDDGIYLNQINTDDDISNCNIIIGNTNSNQSDNKNEYNNEPINV